MAKQFTPLFKDTGFEIPEEGVHVCVNEEFKFHVDDKDKNKKAIKITSKVSGGTDDGLYCNWHFTITGMGYEKLEERNYRKALAWIQASGIDKGGADKVYNDDFFEKNVQRIAGKTKGTIYGVDVKHRPSKTSDAVFLEAVEFMTAKEANERLKVSGGTVGSTDNSDVDAEVTGPQDDWDS